MAHSKILAVILDLKSLIRSVPGFPSKGVLFRDLTHLMGNPEAIRHVTATLAGHLRSRRVEAVAAIDSRGFIFGAPVAYELGIPFVPVRKAGKLPPPVVGVDYTLEYGTARLEMNPSSVRPGQKLAVLDDLLATGGSAGAAIELITSLGADIVSTAFVIELTFLRGRETLPLGTDVFSMVQY